MRKITPKVFLLLLSLLTLQTVLFAQEWTPFPINQKTFFEFKSETHYSIALHYAANVVVKGDSTHYYLDPNNTLAQLNTNLTCINDYENLTSDFISIQHPYTEVSGMYYYKNKLVFNPNLNMGEGVFINSANYTGFDSIYMECIKQNMQNVFGVMDEVKVFSLQAYKNDKPVESTFNEHTYELSKTFGFLKFLPFNELLNEPKTTAGITGFEDKEGKFFGTRGNHFKTPYEVGDVIYYSEFNRIGFSNPSTRKNWRDSITQVINYKDSTTYTFNRLEIVETGLIDVTETDTIQTADNVKTVRFPDSADILYYSTYGYKMSPNSMNPVKISVSDFSFQQNESAFNVKIDGSYFPIYDGCYRLLSLFFSSSKYHNELGKISESYSGDTGDNYHWNLLAYKKGNRMYSPFTELDSTYIRTDTVINLIKTINNCNDEISGIGVQDCKFNPNLVPDSLLNTPIEISYTLGPWEFKNSLTVIAAEEEVINSISDNAVASNRTSFSLYPNPAKNHVFLSANQNNNEVTEIALYHIDGKQLKSVETKQHSFQSGFKLDISDLKKGIYIVQLKTESNSTVQKLFVQ